MTQGMCKCGPGHVGEGPHGGGGILALGAGRLVSLGRSACDTGKLQHLCILKCFCHTGSRLLLDNHDHTDKSARFLAMELRCSDQYQKSMCVSFLTK